MKRKHRDHDSLAIGRVSSEPDTSVDNLSKFIGKDIRYRYEGTTTQTNKKTAQRRRMSLLTKCNLKNNDGMDNFGFGIVSMFRLTRYLAFFYAISSLLSCIMIISNYTADGISLHVPNFILAMVHITLGNIGFSETRCNFN